MLRAKVCLVVDITEAQCPRIQPVLRFIRRTRNNRTVQLRVLPGGDVKAFLTGKQP
ncbi:TPA: hypothetical protein G9F27_004691, partial [Salmonella enterica]|nr:hypothetical protein [Salmonella enterica]